MNKRKFGPRLPNNAYYSRNRRRRYTRSGRRYGTSKRARTYTQGQLSNARIGGLLGIERKFTDRHFANAFVTTLETAGETNPSNGPLNGLNQGDGASDRDGRKATFKSLQIRGHFHLDIIDQATSFTNAVTGARTVRFVVVLDRQNNAVAAAPVWQDVFDTATVSAINTQNWEAYRKLSNSKRFKILVDKVYTFNPGASTNNGDVAALRYHRQGMKKAFNIYRKIPIVTEYTGTGDTGASIADNAIWVLTMADAANAVSVDYIARLRFCG